MYSSAWQFIGLLVALLGTVAVTTAAAVAGTALQISVHIHDSSEHGKMTLATSGQCRPRSITLENDWTLYNKHYSGSRGWLKSWNNECGDFYD